MRAGGEDRKVDEKEERKTSAKTIYIKCKKIVEKLGSSHLWINTDPTLNWL